MPGRIGLEPRTIDHCVLGPVRRAPCRIQFRNEHVSRKQVVPREFGDDADRETIRRIGAAPGIEHVQVLVLEVRHHVAMQGVEMRFINWTIDTPPVHVLLGRRFLDRELVLGRPSRVLTGARDEWTVRRENGFAAPEGNFVENRRAQVPVNASRPDNTKGLETMRPLNLCAHLGTLLGKTAEKTKNASYHGAESPQIPV